ncbi:MAG: pre-peptidase C-terminal domain-containing protein [Sulfurimonas sp.]|jgi:Ca2+-binding RTX toxin-like protein
MSEVINNRVSLADAGNTFSEATNLTETLNRVRGTLSSSDLNDWYKFSPTSSGTVTINLSGLTADADIYLYQDPQSSYMARPYNSGRTDELISAQVTAGQTYYIKVNDYNKDSINYSLSVDLPAASPTLSLPPVITNPLDDFSATTVTAGRAILNGSTRGNIESLGDIDWFKIELAAGQKIQVDLKGSPTNSGTLADTLIGGIYNSNGTLQVNTINDDFGGGRNSQVTYTANTAGTYYIEAKAYDNYIGTYRLEVASLNSIAPDTEVTADQIYDKAMSYVGTAWGASNCTGFVYTVSHVLGHDFFTDNDASYAGNEYNNALINNGSGSNITNGHSFVVPIGSDGNNRSQENRGDWTAIYHEQADGSTNWLTDIAAGDFVRATFSGTVHSGVVAGYDELNQKLYLIDNYNNNTKIEVKAHAISSINVTNGTGVNQGWVDVSRYNSLGNNSNDLLSGSNADDIIGGGGGIDTIVGNAGIDRLFGNSGNDTLDGGIGFDHLYGGSGNDTFVLSIALNGNADRIYDFTIGDDKIALNKSVFTKFTNETILISDYFSNKGKARDSNDYITYNKKTGDIHYDADGNGIQVAIRIAVLDTKPPELSASDFMLIA